jgi:amino acid transporter
MTAFFRRGRSARQATGPPTTVLGWTRLLARLMLPAALLGAAYALAPVGRRPSGDIAVRLSLALLVVAALLVWQIQSLLRTPNPRLRGVQTIATVVPMLILVFATTFAGLSAAAPDSFNQTLTKVDSLYFTVTVFATVGFGDIVPLSEQARALVTFQMVVNLVTIGVVARVVVGVVQHRVRGLSEEPDRQADEPAPSDQGEGEAPGPDR